MSVPYTKVTYIGEQFNSKNSDNLAERYVWCLGFDRIYVLFFQVNGAGVWLDSLIVVSIGA